MHRIIQGHLSRSITIQRAVLLPPNVKLIRCALEPFQHLDKGALVAFPYDLARILEAAGAPCSSHEDDNLINVLVRGHVLRRVALSGEFGEGDGVVADSVLEFAAADVVGAFFVHVDAGFEGRMLVWGVVGFTGRGE